MGRDAATINKETTWSFWRGFSQRQKASQTRTSSRAKRSAKKGGTATVCCCWCFKVVLCFGVCLLLMLTSRTD